MKTNILFLFFILVAAGCILTAALMAYNGLPNWGWFLFSGILILAGITIKENE